MMTPLFSAIHNGHLDIVKTLIAKPSIDINKKDNEGMTPLVIAALRDHMEIVAALLAHRDIEKNTQCLEGYLNRYGTKALSTQIAKESQAFLKITGYLHLCVQR